MEDLARQHRKALQMKFTDVSMARDIPEGEDLSGYLGRMLLLYLSLVLGLVSMHVVYRFPLLQFSAQNRWTLL